MPYRSIALAILLVILGGGMMIGGLWMAVEMPKRAVLGGVVRGWTMIALGGLMLLPGACMRMCVYVYVCVSEREALCASLFV